MKSNLKPLSADLPKYIKSLGHGTKKYRGIETGIKDLDDLTKGLSGLVLLSGKAGIGKSSLAVQIATSAILAKDETCDLAILFYSLEMPTSALLVNFIQNCAHHLGHELTRDEIENPSENSEVLDAAIELCQTKVAPSLYIITETPTILDKPQGIRSICSDIKEIKSIHKCKDVLVIIDSVQDIVDTQHSNQTQAEVQCCNDLTTLIAETDCTVLAIGQKNKGSTKSFDHYGDTMGSVAFIHKSNNVLLLNSLQEVALKKGLIPKMSSALDSIAKYTKKTKKSPLELRQIKGRFSGEGATPVVFHMDKGYFDWELDYNAADILGK